MDSVSDAMSRTYTSFTAAMARKRDLYLPTHTNTTAKSRFQVRALLGHCLYRRVVIWTAVVFVFLTAVFFDLRLSTQSRNVLDMVHGSKGVAKEIPSVSGNMLLPNQNGVDGDLLNLVDTHRVGTEIAPDTGEDIMGNIMAQKVADHGVTNDDATAQEAADQEVENQRVLDQDIVTQGEAKDIPKNGIKDDDTGHQGMGKSQDEEDKNAPKWLKYKHLDGYYRGLRALVRFADYLPEYPRRFIVPNPSEPIPTPHHTVLPKPSVYQAHPDYNSEEWRKNYVQVNPCYIDSDQQIPAPELYAYPGLIQGQPEAAIGSYETLGLRSDVCFDRFGRYGPYGLGYSLDRGGVSESLDTESEGSEVVWEKTGQINWNEVDWAAAQTQCFSSNQGRFFTGNQTRDAELASTGQKKLHRTAVVVRTYVGFKWTAHAVLNFRAMISELNLRSGGEYDVHFLLHVRDNSAPIWADPATAQEIIATNVPAEFHGLCTLWSEAQMKLLYPGDFGDTFENPSNGDIHGVYRSAHMPLQHFAVQHPEYAHFWNWEMDMRWTGSYYELFDRLGKWGSEQNRVGAWERSAKYYIPGMHGTWGDFSELVSAEIQESNRQPVLGPVSFAGKIALNQNDNFLPASCTSEADLSQCGVGEEADLIALNPLFDADESGWVFSGDVTGYETMLPKPPRRCSIVTASRLSRRLLLVMHEETWRLRHSMFSEMFPSTMAFHHGLKAVYAPHPVFLDRDWPQMEIDRAFNGGKDHSSGGHGSPFDFYNEHYHKGSTWYYNSEFAGLLWRRWLGYAQMDGRGNNGGRAGEGAMRGGREEEQNPASSGRLCLRSMLVHPIKWEDPAEKED